MRAALLPLIDAHGSHGKLKKSTPCLRKTSLDNIALQHKEYFQLLLLLTSSSWVSAGCVGTLYTMKSLENATYDARAVDPEQNAAFMFSQSYTAT